MRENGRSMVEMLGVLAIIGVLSIGAMSGYAKAMFKYKLNRQTEQIGSILDYITLYNDKLQSVTPTLGTSIGVLLKKLGAIPQEMIKDPNVSYFYDVFDNKVTIYYNKEDTPLKPQYNGLRVDIAKDARDVCLNLFQMAKLRSNTLWITQFSKDSDDGTKQGNRVYGDAYCSASATYCLKNLTLEQMHDLCSYCSDSTGICTFVFLWNFKFGE